MLDYTRLAPGEPADRAVVLVTFLRMEHRKFGTSPRFPAGATLRPESLNVTQYRDLYNKVGGPWLWWLRRIMPDDMLARHLASPMVAIEVLRMNGEIAGFFETETSGWPDVNLNYFGLMPQMIGKGLGAPLLAAAIDSVFIRGSLVRGMTVNTCTADHPRALPNYLAAGFKEVRRVKEVWDIPRRLGLTVPEHLRG